MSWENRPKWLASQPREGKRGSLYVNARYAPSLGAHFLSLALHTGSRYSVPCTILLSLQYQTRCTYTLHTKQQQTNIHPQPQHYRLPHSDAPTHTATCRRDPYSASRYFRELAGLRVTPDETDIPLRH
jgi:hypothetical protein